MEQLVKSNIKLGEFKINEQQVSVVESGDPMLISVILELQNNYLCTNLQICLQPHSSPIQYTSSQIKTAHSQFQPLLINTIHSDKPHSIKIQAIGHGNALKLEFKSKPNNQIIECFQQQFQKVTVFGYSMEQSPQSNQVVPLLNVSNLMKKYEKECGDRERETMKLLILKMDLLLAYSMINARRFTQANEIMDKLILSYSNTGNYQQAAKIEVLKGLSIKYPKIQNKQNEQLIRACIYCQNKKLPQEIPQLLDLEPLFRFLLKQIELNPNDINLIQASLNIIEFSLENKVLQQLDNKYQQQFHLSFLALIFDIFNRFMKNGLNKKRKNILDHFLQILESYQNGIEEMTTSIVEGCFRAIIYQIEQLKRMEVDENNRQQYWDYLDVLFRIILKMLQCFQANINLLNGIDVLDLVLGNVESLNGRFDNLWLNIHKNNLIMLRGNRQIQLLTYLINKLNESLLDVQTQIIEYDRVVKVLQDLKIKRILECLNEISKLVKVESMVLFKDRMNDEFMDSFYRKMNSHIETLEGWLRVIFNSIKISDNLQLFQTIFTCIPPIHRSLNPPKQIQPFIMQYLAELQSHFLNNSPNPNMLRLILFLVSQLVPLSADTDQQTVSFFCRFLLDFADCIPHNINDESFLVLEQLFIIVKNHLNQEIIENSFKCLVNQFTIKVQIQKSCKQHLIQQLSLLKQNNLIVYFLDFCFDQQFILGSNIGTNQDPKQNQTLIQQKHEKTELVLDFIQNSSELVYEYFIQQQHYLIILLENVLGEMNSKQNNVGYQILIKIQEGLIQHYNESYDSKQILIYIDSLNYYLINSIKQIQCENEFITDYFVQLVVNSINLIQMVNSLPQFLNIIFKNLLHLTLLIQLKETHLKLIYFQAMLKLMKHIGQQNEIDKQVYMICGKVIASLVEDQQDWINRQAGLLFYFVIMDWNYIDGLDCDNQQDEYNLTIKNQYNSRWDECHQQIWDNINSKLIELDYEWQEDNIWLLNLVQKYIQILQQASPSFTQECISHTDSLIIFNTSLSFANNKKDQVLLNQPIVIEKEDYQCLQDNAIMKTDILIQQKRIEKCCMIDEGQELMKCIRIKDIDQKDELVEKKEVEQKENEHENDINISNNNISNENEDDDLGIIEIDDQEEQYEWIDAVEEFETLPLLNKQQQVTQQPPLPPPYPQDLPLRPTNPLLRPLTPPIKALEKEEVWSVEEQQQLYQLNPQMYIKFVSWFKEQKKKRPNSAQTHLGGESEVKEQKIDRKRPTNPNYIRNKQNKR